VIGPGGAKRRVSGTVAGALLLLSLCLGVASATETLPMPQSPAILVVSGGITVANQDGKAVLDLAFLQSLPQASITTETPWTNGEVHFEGVRMRDLMARLGAHGEKVMASGIDEYGIEIPMADFQDYDVILAYAEDGKLLPPDDKGPLWIVYPFSADPGLKKDIYFARCVWQLSRLSVQ